MRTPSVFSENSFVRPSAKRLAGAATWPQRPIPVSIWHHKMSRLYSPTVYASTTRARKAVSDKNASGNWHQYYGTGWTWQWNGWVTYTSPNKVEFEINPQHERLPAAEKEKPVRLRGRLGIPFRIKNSPTGGTMAVSSFAEHPNRGAVWSYSNTFPEKPQKDTAGGRLLHLTNGWNFQSNLSLAKSSISPVLYTPGLKRQKTDKKRSSMDYTCWMPIHLRGGLNGKHRSNKRRQSSAAVSTPDPLWWCAEVRRKVQCLCMRTGVSQLYFSINTGRTSKRECSSFWTAMFINHEPGYSKDKKSFLKACYV